MFCVEVPYLTITIDLQSALFLKDVFNILDTPKKDPEIVKTSSRNYGFFVLFENGIYFQIQRQLLSL